MIFPITVFWCVIFQCKSETHYKELIYQVHKSEITMGPCLEECRSYIKEHIKLIRRDLIQF